MTFQLSYAYYLKMWRISCQTLLMSIEGHLHTYRFCDNVWTFILQDAVFKNEECQENVGRLK
ncbi:hypothetical protein AAG906_029864 [Vitis piasezkii]